MSQMQLNERQHPMAQHPALKPMRNALQAYIGERDNAGLRISELVVGDFTKHDVRALATQPPARPFAWICGWAGTHLVWADQTQVSNRHTYRAPTIVEWVYATCEAPEPDALRVAMYLWDGRQLIHCTTLGELQDRLRRVSEPETEGARG